MMATPGLRERVPRASLQPRFPKPRTKPAHGARLMETRRSDSNPKVRELIVIGGPFVPTCASNLHLAARVTFENGPINSAHRHFTIIN